MYSTNYKVVKNNDDYGLAEWSLRDEEWRVGTTFLQPVFNSIILTQSELEERDKYLKSIE